MLVTKYPCFRRNWSKIQKLWNCETISWQPRCHQPALKAEWGTLKWSPKRSAHRPAANSQCHQNLELKMWQTFYVKILFRTAFPRGEYHIYMLVYPWNKFNRFAFFPFPTWGTFGSQKCVHLLKKVAPFKPTRGKANPGLTSFN